MKQFIETLPKIELHLHIEGTLEPEMMLHLSQKNQIPIPYQNLEEIKRAYRFQNLQSFLDVYYAGASVLCEQEDFFDLTWAYMLQCKENHVIHSEIFFDPQTHIMRGIPISRVVGGITQALKKAKEELGISSVLIACILRHLTQEEGIKALEELIPYKKDIVAIGLDSSEIGNPPSKFRELFARAKEEGFLLVAHAGEEADYTYIQEALELGASRIDHGVQCDKSEELVEFLKIHRIPLTMCPLSNYALKVTPDLTKHNLLELLRKGLCVTINSDDPAYFGGYMNTNFEAVYEALHPTKEEMRQFSLNALEASFLSYEEKEELKRKFFEA
ncbi:adenosine deaminase [Helicobacter kayseriensis]|uniref:adenosine deaminase n=1 Tax=Helicobacter kayseriensis TaxID=2905877 RepID=UPI001E4A403C|nr:adenosine deaminase [Helicobacter kayseriensis]MCE3046590.1 adenosine deaminase [Helicobacter kayseriensis]MCE3048108.1 adenosine deaminase [Helicobacter kayseriensis]